MYLLLFLCTIGCLFFNNFGYDIEECADFNIASKALSNTGIFPTKDVWTCPNDGIGGVACKNSFPIKVDNSTSQINWKDIVIMCLIGDHPRLGVISWWLQFFPVGVHKLNLLFFANACPKGNEPCNDTAQQLLVALKEKYGQTVHMHLVRAQYGADAGYFRLSCKLLTCMLKMLKHYSDKKYFFKIDDDTVLFPQRLLRLIRTLDSAVQSDKVPLLVGTTLNDHKPFMLCNIIGFDENLNEILYSKDFKDNRIPRNATKICSPQGGAGYLMNRLAISAFENTSLCTLQMDLETVDEDSYVPYKIYKEYRAKVVHCGSFRPHGALCQQHLDYAISFHHVNDEWLTYLNVSNLIHDYRVMD